MRTTIYAVLATKSIIFPVLILKLRTMKNPFTLLALLVLILATGCKKENTDPDNNNTPNSETAAWDALADANAQQYMIIAHNGDTTVLQDTRHLTITLTHDLWPNLFGYRGIKAAFFTPDHPGFDMELRLIKRVSTMSNVVDSVDCELVDEVCNTDSFTLWGNKKYFSAVHWDNGSSDFSTEYYDLTLYNGNVPDFIIKETKLISTSDGCNTYRIKGLISCNVIFYGCTDTGLTRNITVYACFNVKVPTQ
jgi:hypothetical protein